MKTKVAVIKCNSYDQAEVDRAIKTALNLLGGLGAIVKPKNRVLLKPYLSSFFPPGKGGSTHPSVVRGMVKLIKQTKAIPVIGDGNEGGPEVTVRAIAKSGMRRVAREERIETRVFEYAGFSPVAIPEGKQIKQVCLANSLRETDVIISLAKLKTHGFTMLSGAVRNLFRCISNHDRMKIHGSFVSVKPISQAIVDLYSLVRPQLAVIDGIIAIEGNGPNEGTPRNLNVIIASYDSVAADAVAAEICGFKPDEVLTTRLADEQGLGCGKLSSIEILGSSIEEVRCPDFKRPDRYIKIRNQLGFLFLKAAFKMGLKRIYYNRPEINKAKCDQCGLCIEHCPVGAITMRKYPEIKRGKCIECFTCQEFCPEKAIEIKSSVIAKVSC